MKIGVMQPYFFPYIGYWQLMNEVDEYIIFDDVNYIKRGWINRNNILCNGMSKRINLYIKDASQNRLIKDTKICQSEEDNRILLETIKQCYSKAPYFTEVYKIISEIMYFPTDDLALFLRNQMEIICNYLSIHTKLLFASEINIDQTLKGEQRILALCKKRNADMYINAIGGKELYHKEDFERENLSLKFLKTGDIYYKQYEDEFVPSLSIIDIMMFNDISKIKGLLEKFELED